MNHLDEVSGADRTGVDIALLDPCIASIASGGARDIAETRRQRSEDRIEAIHHFLVAADHHAVAPVDAPDAAGSADVDIMYAALLQSLAAAHVILPEGVAAIDDDVAGPHQLQGFDPSRVVIAGDSAGGGLAIATMVSLRDAGMALPGCAWCVSPWVDLAMTGESMTTKAATDPLIQKDYLEELAAAYLNGADAATPLASPLHAGLAGLPPLLIQVGSAETLLDDSVRLAGRAGAADVRVILEVWPDMIHVWPLFHQQVAAGRRALASAGTFIRAALGSG